jgi:hypothetical protein
MSRTFIVAALFLAFAAAVLVSGRSRSSAVPGIGVQGDSDCDQQITLTDPLSVLKYSAGFGVPSCLRDSDVNCDDSTDGLDVLRLLSYLAGALHDSLDDCLEIGQQYHFTPSPLPTSVGATLSPPPGPTFTPTPTSPTNLTPTPTPQPTNTPIPGQTPQVGGEPSCQIFPADNWWNTDISNFSIDSNSDNYVDFVGRNTYLHPDAGTVWDGKPIGIPYVIVGGNQPKVPITYYYPDSDPGPYPIPADVPVEGQPIGAPNTDNFGGDRHVIVIDETACKLYETFDSHPVNNGQSWTTGSAATFDLDSNALRPDTWTSADAAGLPIYAGLIRYEEVVEQGEIDHALRFTTRDTQMAFIHPATHYASETADANVPPMGLRFRMKSTYNCSWASSEVQVICAALKKYGMFVADNGTDWYLSGAPDSRWNDDALGDLKSITGNAFEVVDTGEPIIYPN